MAKNQRQKLYDDLNYLLDQYPRMEAAAAIKLVEDWLHGVQRSVRAHKHDPKLKRRPTPGDRTHTYRLA